MKRIGCVGDNCVDHYRQTGEDHFGGNPVNVAVYTRRLGGDISYVGAVGTDGRGAALLDALRGRGVWRTPWARVTASSPDSSTAGWRVWTSPAAWPPERSAAP